MKRLDGADRQASARSRFMPRSYPVPRWHQGEASTFAAFSWGPSGTFPARRLARPAGSLHAVASPSRWGGARRWSFAPRNSYAIRFTLRWCCASTR